MILRRVAVRFCVLGPVRAWRDDVELDLGFPKQRAVLALLLLAGGAHVSAEQLVDGVWGEDPPRTALGTVRGYVYRLRQVIGAGPECGIASTGGGYSLRVGDGTVDLAEFKALLARARDGGGTAAGLLAEALALWHGTALAEVPGPYARAQRDQLDQLRLAAVQDHLACRLELGRYAEVASELSVLVAEHPLVERLRELLMLALYGAGRQAEALAVYAATRRVLRDELGVDPAPRLQEVHRRILAADPTLARDTAAGTPGPPARAPAQLPADVPHFVGRADQLRQLGDLVGERAVVVIGGMAGVGKTSLAVHAAHQHAASFPDGQLYLNLRGFGPAGPALDPAEGLGSMLHALGVPADGLPADLADRAALYRSLLADRRVIVVLDNAHDAAQVRPLLPAGGGCLAIVTSRNRLPGLGATHGAQPLRLPLLSVPEARRFLSSRLGRRADTAPAAVLDEIIDLCARLPLALAIVAARGAQDPDLPLAPVAEELRSARGGLDAFAGEDDVTDVRAVFSWSYEALSPLAARLFRRLAAFPGREVTVPAAASLLASTAAEARAPLAELCRAHLLTEQVPGRYQRHDLLHAYATELTGGLDAAADRRQALHRLLDHYTHAAAAASRLYSPLRHPLDLPPARPGVCLTGPATAADATAWFADEYPVLLTLVSGAAGFDEHAWRLAWAAREYLDRRGLWHELAAMNRAALVAAERLADPLAGGHVHNGLVRADGHAGRFAEAEEHADRAIELFERAGDPAGLAESHLRLSWVVAKQHRYDEALGHARRALELYRATGDRARQPLALNAVGWYQALLGRYREALAHCREALSLLEELGIWYGRADTWDSIGYAHHQLGQYREAVRAYQHASRVYRDFGARFPEADSLVRLGDTQRAAGDPAAAADTWTRALAILDDLGHDLASDVRTRLAELAESSGAVPVVMAT